MRTIRLMLAVAALSVACEGSAAAQAMFTASLGNAFGGDAPGTKSTWAVAIGGSGAHGIGSELEYSETRDFFETPGGVAYGKVISLMPSIFVAFPIDRLRPYGTFGFGLIRQRLEENAGGVFSNLSENEFGYSVGGGVIFHFASHAGVRADLRHFKVNASNGISFQRFLFGVVVGG